MAIEPESLYLQLAHLVSEMPDLEAENRISPDTYRWLATASVLVSEAKVGAGGVGDAVSFRISSDNLQGSLRERHAHQIRAIVYRALAKAEADAPAAYRGNFIPVGAEFTALQAIGKVLAEAAKEVLFIDAYMDATVLTDFAPMAPPQVNVLLLSDSFYTKPDKLLPAATRWENQFGTSRLLEARLSAPRALHDRLIFVDRKTVWTVSQSLKDLANRSPASVQRVDAEMAQMKLDYYSQTWGEAQPLA